MRPGAMDVTVGRRLKAQGTSWYRLGAHHVPTPRILQQNGGWARYWQARRSRSPLLAALQLQRRNLGCISGYLNSLT